MQLTLYTAPMTSAGRVQWALEELHLPYATKTLDFAQKEQKSPGYLALNPNGKVPLLVADGTPIYEGLAIQLFLGETFGVEKGLYPPAGLERAVAVRWMVWGQVTLGEAVGRYVRNASDRLPADERNAKQAETARADIRAHLAILENALEGREHVLGGFTLVDIGLAGFVMFGGRMGAYEQSEFPRAAAWTERLRERAAWKTVMGSPR